MKRLASQVLKLLSRRKTRSKTHRIRGPIHTKHLGALTVADVPSEDALHPRRHLLFGDLALNDPSGVGLAPVLVGRVDLVLDGLNQPTTEADSHRAAGQPLRLQPLQVFQQWAQLLNLPRVELVGPLREWDGSASRPIRKRWRRVVKVEPPLFPTSVVVGDYADGEFPST
jgi:hypothetical protein